jgi:hypothetical protein
MTPTERKQKKAELRLDDDVEEEQTPTIEKTSIQLSATTRDRLYRLKFRRTYDQFINELCDLYEKELAEGT